MSANDQFVVILSPSCDTDVIVMAVVHRSTERVIIDNGNGECGRMTACDQAIDNEQRSEMIVFHSFTGCDYTSSFFSQGKTLLGRKQMWSQHFLPHYQYWEIKSHLMMKYSAPQKSTLVVHMVVTGKISTNRDSKSLLRNISERKSMSILPCSHLVETVFCYAPNEQIELPTWWKVQILQ